LWLADFVPGIRFNLRSDPRRRVSFGPSIDHRLITVLQHNDVEVE
jgi:hypothetical protein